MTQAERLLREARDELRWCSGSPDFNEGGQARVGWIKGPQQALARIDAYLARPEPQAASAETPETDAQVKNELGMVMADFARSLERRLREAEAEGRRTGRLELLAELSGKRYEAAERGASGEESK